MTTGKDRIDLGFGDELENFNPDDWKPDPGRKEAPAKKVTEEAARTTGFKSREAKATPQQRRHRTGRSAQFNVKARPETIQAFVEVADAQQWSLAETFEHAVALLQERFAEDA